MVSKIRKPFPVKRPHTVTTANIAAFKELWAEQHDKPPTTENVLDYIIPCQSVSR